MPAAYSLRESPFKAQATWALEDGALVRRAARAEARWPLSALTRMTLSRQANRYGPDLRFAQLHFGGKTVAFASRHWLGVGRPRDQTADFADFVRRLAAEAASRAPSARFEIGGYQARAGALYGAAALLGAGILIMGAMAISAGAIVMGLDLSARLLFVLILLLAAAPWLPGRRARDFDPLAVPEDLAPAKTD